VSGAPADDPYELRTTSTVRALSETLPEAVAAAADEFITGPLLTDPHRIGFYQGGVSRRRWPGVSDGLRLGGLPPHAGLHAGR
jgi:hypothetical protein